jgi:hypothetical protein
MMGLRPNDPGCNPRCSGCNPTYPGEQACSPRAAPPVMMTAGKGGKGKGKEKEPRECSNTCQSSSTKHRGPYGLGAS